MTTRKIWVSTYCNFAHDAKTGAPIKHECERLNPYAMRLERADRFDLIGDKNGKVSIHHRSEWDAEILQANGVEAP